MVIRMKCSVCEEEVEACDNCMGSFIEGDIIWCYNGKHYCSPDCLADSIGCLEGEVVE